MNIFGKISLLLWLIAFAAAAIMFDWFGSREIATSFLDSTQTAVEKLEMTGDQVQDVIDVVSEDNQFIDSAKESVKEKTE